MLTLRRVFTLAALWLLVDLTFSWLAFCDPVSSNPAEQYYHKEPECSPFRGPLVSSTLFLLRWFGHTLHEYGEAVIAGFTVILALSTIALWRSTERLWQAGERQIEYLERTAETQSRDMQASIAEAKKSSEAAKRAADVAQETLLTTDRAWIEIEVAIAGPLKVGPEKMSIEFKVTITNVGKAPAIQVSPYATLHTDIVAASAAAEERARHERQFGFTAHYLGYGRVLFPSRNFTLEWEADLSVKKFKESIVSRARDIAESATEDDPPRPADDLTHQTPAITIGVRYALPGEKRLRFTIMPFAIQHMDDLHPGWDGSEGETAADKLILTQQFLSGQVR